ncbi:iron-sulfur cluster assembly accessory protein [Hassallia byssoidea VB512170]|uniref:Iron-sulfur cluster assembly accessory protein n=1 Tax=Hassallia byssoidea VB512170 TaxID=1304833 RepID=A0A846HCR4_9CYAN|nr:iron-sulfur cluster assembly accessory protein [Hassalia byssoidea]NEU74833.1 iron-sulfur cluster assembly accessory protein [Hassalia byssoidea VB512170]
MIELSQSAVSEIGRLKSKQLPPNIFVRLAVKPGGCSGWFYDMSFDETVKDDDRLFNSHGIQILIDPASLDYINGLILDYSEDLMGGGFRFHNQRAIATCGCGNSFSISQ